MKDFMEFLEQTAENPRTPYGIDDGPNLVARAQTADRRAAIGNPMLMAQLVQQRPLQAEVTPLSQTEREKKVESPWWMFTQGILLGAAMATLLLIGILI